MTKLWASHSLPHIIHRETESARAFLFDSNSFVSLTMSQNSQWIAFSVCVFAFGKISFRRFGLLIFTVARSSIHTIAISISLSHSVLNVLSPSLFYSSPRHPHSPLPAFFSFLSLSLYLSFTFCQPLSPLSVSLSTSLSPSLSHSYFKSKWKISSKRKIWPIKSILAISRRSIYSRIICTVSQLHRPSISTLCGI